jgi:hypothetical protein
MNISIDVIPGSKKNVVTRIFHEKFEVKLRAEAEHGEANSLLIKVLAEYFNKPPSAIKIISGHHTRHKRVEIK